MMRKIKILIFSSLALIFLISSSYSKSLPPGSGTADIPSNVLILLDKSGSMTVNTSVGATLGGVRSMHPLATGDVIFFNSQYLKRLNHSNNAISQLEVGGSRMSYRQSRRNRPCHTSNVRNLTVHNNIAYGITSRGQFFSVDLANNFTCRKIKNGYIGGSDSELILYDNKIYIVTRFGVQVYDTNTLLITALNNTGTFSTITQDMRNDGSIRVRTHFDIDSSGNLVVVRQKPNSNQRTFELFKFDLSNWNGNASETYTINNNDIANYPGGLATHPSDDDIFYVPSFTKNKIHKLEISGGSLISNTSVGRSGRITSSYDPTTKNQVRFRGPKETKIANNLVYVHDQGNAVVHTFDLNLEPDDHAGTFRNLTRMQGAQEAILAIVNDSSITASVNIGFAYWSAKNSQIWISPRRFSRGGQRSFPCKNIVPPKSMSHLNPGWISNSAWFVQRNWQCVVLNPNATYGFDNWEDNDPDGNGHKATPCDGQNCLKIRVDRNGARNVRGYIRSVRPGGGTDAEAWSTIAEQYFKNDPWSPHQYDNCQGNYLIVIGDGDMFSTDKAEASVKRMLGSKAEVKTFTVAYGGGLSPTGLRQLDKIAKAGGTDLDRAIRASNPDVLKAELISRLRSIISENLSFTAPSITASVNEGGQLYQAQFKFKQNRDWEGDLIKKGLDSDGNPSPTPTWNARKKMPDPDDRKIWSVIPGADYKTDYNNVTEANSDFIAPEFLRLENIVKDYHTETPVGSATNNRCKFGGDSSGSIETGNEDDIKGLISFLRGEDYFDFKGKCNLNAKRVNPEDGFQDYLGDIYHSEMVVVGKPSAFTNFSNIYQESYFRTLNGYGAFKGALQNRQEVIYVGANDGMLHAFDAKTGIEKWAFIPPFMMGKMPLIINPALNKIKPGNRFEGDGGSNAIYGVDGSPVVHDMFFKGPHDTVEKWHTIMIVPFGRGGNGFSVIDVTDTEKPLHLYTIYNDANLNKILYMDHDGDNIIEYEYIDDVYSINDFEESKEVLEKYKADNTISASCESDLSLGTSCYQSDTWTFPVSNIQDGDVKIIIDNVDKTSDTTITVAPSSGKTTFKFDTEYFFQGSDSTDTPEPATIKVVIARAKLSALNTELPAEFDYKELGETWSSPRILRVPNNYTGDNNTLDDTYVAVMGGGYGGRNDNVGSTVYVINLQDTFEDPSTGTKMYGRLYEGAGNTDEKGIILIEDTKPAEIDHDIVNSVTGTPVVITSDIEPSANFSGGIVYVNDMEGKITKINLTNQTNTNMLDNSIIFNLGSTTKNGQYMFHGMDATIGSISKNLWLFTGTGDFERITELSTDTSKAPGSSLPTKDIKKIENYMIGVRDKDYPFYKDGIARNIKDLSNCSKIETGVFTGCPAESSDPITNNGWYVPLKRDQKVTAEPTAANGKVLFPIYEPVKIVPGQSLSECPVGAAYICKVDDECGYNESGDLKINDDATKLDRECAYVGQGVLSKIVVFGNKIFANIAGEAAGDQKDLVVAGDKKEDIIYYRSSWREGNF